MRHVAWIGALALTSCSSLLGSSGGQQNQNAARPPTPPVYEQRAPMQSGIASSPHSVADVMNVQQKLRDAGLYNGPVDGQWGSKTIAAMRSYQQQNDLPVTGVADHATLVRMDLAQPDS
jgi:peptidoglycan hydrolase-like protein with peptidoglycan-binding domain